MASHVVGVPTSGVAWDDDSGGAPALAVPVGSNPAYHARSMSLKRESSQQQGEAASALSRRRVSRKVAPEGDEQQKANTRVGVSEAFLEDFLTRVLPQFGLTREALSTPKTREEWLERLCPKEDVHRVDVGKADIGEVLVDLGDGLQARKSEVEHVRKLICVPRCRNISNWELVEAEINLDKLPAEIDADTPLPVRVKGDPPDAKWIFLPARDVALVQTSDIVDFVIKPITQWKNGKLLIKALETNDKGQATRSERKTYVDHVADVHPKGREWVKRNYFGKADIFVSHAWMDSYQDFSDAMTGGSSEGSAHYQNKLAGQVLSYTPLKNILDDYFRTWKRNSSAWWQRWIAFFVTGLILFPFNVIRIIFTFSGMTFVVRILRENWLKWIVSKMRQHHLIDRKRRWVDIFCKNQWVVNSEGTEDELQDGVGNVDWLWLVTHSWRTPHALRRAWCQFELRAARVKKVGIVGIACYEEDENLRNLCRAVLSKWWFWWSLINPFSFYLLLWKIAYSKHSSEKNQKTDSDNMVANDDKLDSTNNNDNSSNNNNMGVGADNNASNDISESSFYNDTTESTLKVLKESLDSVDAREAKARFDTDKEHILELIRQGVGGGDDGGPDEGQQGEAAIDAHNEELKASYLKLISEMMKGYVGGKFEGFVYMNAPRDVREYRHHVIGTYYQMPNKTINGKPVFEAFNDGEFRIGSTRRALCINCYKRYLYYDEDENWIVGKSKDMEIGESRGWIVSDTKYADSPAWLPADERWKLSHDDKWHDGAVQLTCRNMPAAPPPPAASTPACTFALRDDAPSAVKDADHVLGTYYLVSNKTVNDRPVFELNRDRYLYYDEDENWIVGNSKDMEIGKGAGWIFSDTKYADSPAWLPIDERWELYHDGKWHYGALELTCRNMPAAPPPPAASTPACTFALRDDAPSAVKDADHVLGTYYLLSNKTVNDRPVFELNRDRYLYYDEDDTWIVGRFEDMEVGLGAGWIFSNTKYADSPAWLPADERWSLWHDDKSHYDALELTCRNMPAAPPPPAASTPACTFALRDDAPSAVKDADHVLGTYYLLSNKTVNDRPVFELNRDRYLYYTDTDQWIVGGFEDMEVGLGWFWFRTGWIHSSTTYVNSPAWLPADERWELYYDGKSHYGVLQLTCRHLPAAPPPSLPSPPPNSSSVS
ncbi:hypothetical protein NFJ02_04g118020 [Pycnococcus provasolii]